MKATTILLAGLALGMSPAASTAAPTGIAAAVAAPSDRHMHSTRGASRPRCSISLGCERACG